ncbi:MAG: glycosyltransferase family 39 protein [Deltaproteobacteria bacterium]|nr:glycosyltransferase family 39 protein [Deltaproteobacteria bacterium]
MENAWGSSQSFRYPFFLSLLAVLLYIPALGGRDFWAPVEPRYAEIARIMFAKGEWIIPTVNGDLYTDKPILYFWLVLLGSKLAGGVNEWTVRLPSALSALGLVLTTYALGRDLFGARIGYIAAIVLATSARVLWEARWAHTDMTFTFFFVLSLYFFSRALLRKGKPGEFLLAYGLAALATLTKGLIGIVLPGLIVLAYVALRREWRVVSEWRLPSGILVFLLIAAPWFAWVSQATDGRWLREFIFTHHIQRYTSGLGHRQPFYYYLLTFPADFLPWTVFLVPAIWAYRSRLKLLNEPGALFLFLWFFAILFFFSLSDTKRDLYLLPLFPPAAIFMACYFVGLMDKAISPAALYRLLGLLFFNLLWITALCLPVVAWFYQREAVWISLPFALVMAGGGLTTAVAIWQTLPARGFFSAALTILLGALCASVWILPFLNSYKSARSFAVRVQRIVPSDQPLYIYADTMNDFNFYMEREVISVVSSQAEAESVASRIKTTYMLVRERDLRMVEMGEGGKVLAEGRVGDKRWRLVLLRR